MKKITIYLLMLALAISLGGCGIKEKIEQKAAEAIAEKVIGGAAGTDVDIDGETITIKGEDDQMMVIGENKWPTSDLAKSIPEFKAGKIVSVVDINGSLFIMIEDTSEEDYKSYLDEIKKTFTEGSYELDTDTGMVYGASNDKKISIILSYDKNEGTSIAVADEGSKE